MKKKALIILLPLTFFLFTFLVATALHWKQEIKQGKTETREVCTNQQSETEEMDESLPQEFIWQSLTRHLLIFNP